MKNRYVLLLLLSTVCLYSSEKIEHDESKQIDQVVQVVRDNIDEHLLGMPKNAFCRSMRGALWSFVRCSRLYRMQMITELQVIESYMSKYTCKRQLLFKKLIARHGYFYWLMNCMVGFNLQKLDLVSGLSIDAFNENIHKSLDGLSVELNTFIVEYTKRCYAGLHSQMDKNFDDIPFNINFDIHHMPVFTDYVIETMNVSSDGCYLSGSGADKSTIWNIRDGSVVDSTPLQEIEWCENTDPYRYEDGNYYIVNGKDLSFKETWNSATLAIAYGLSSEHAGRVISLFKRPTYESLLCQRALMRSSGSSSDLKALAESRLVAELEEGFPKVQLEKAISTQLKKLE